MDDVQRTLRIASSAAERDALRDRRGRKPKTEYERVWDAQANEFVTRLKKRPSVPTVATQATGETTAQIIQRLAGQQGQADVLRE
jgi:hypothetical protein